MFNFLIGLQNLREAIAAYRNSILRQPDEMKREAALSYFVEYLERYYFLICFAVYIHSERAALHPSSFGNSSFADWMRARPELYSILRRYLCAHAVILFVNVWLVFSLVQLSNILKEICELHLHVYWYQD